MSYVYNNTQLRDVDVFQQTYNLNSLKMQINYKFKKNNKMIDTRKIRSKLVLDRDMV